MKRLIMMLVAFLLVGTGAMMAQEDTKAARKAAKEAEKAEREAQEMLAFEAAKKALFAKDFVLEAERVEFKRGNFKYVTPSTNFVSLVDGKATVQLAFDGAVFFWSERDRRYNGRRNAFECRSRDRQERQCQL